MLVYSLGATGGRAARADADAGARARAAARETLDLGATQYATYCDSCHGPNAVNLGILPDLRYSALLHSSEAWRDVVLGGAMADNGMAGFDAVLDPEQAEAIRAYVIEQANAAR